MTKNIRRRAGVMAAAMLATVTLAACSSFDREGSIELLMDGSGFTRAQAECIVDGLVDELGEDKVTSDDELSEEDQAVVFRITGECIG